MIDKNLLDMQKSLSVENLKIAKDIKIKEDNKKLQEEIKAKKEKVGNRIRRTGGSMFNSIKTFVNDFKESSPWFGFINEFKSEVGVVWVSYAPNRLERRRHYKYKVNNKSVETSHPSVREQLRKEKREQLLRSFRLNTCKELR